ncbi:MAG: RNA-binding protein [Chloroflexi bacterium]|nr:RNA-binding protein [Chloroflexota bacterium]
MAKKVYVGNLSFSATEEDVRDLFSEYGEVESVAMINDRDTGRFRGFCFVEMAPSAADAAIAALDGKEIGGRNLRVNEARPREERSGGGGNRGGDSRGGGGRSDSRGGGGRSDSRGGGGRSDSGGGYGRRNDYSDRDSGGRRW